MVTKITGHGACDKPNGLRSGGFQPPPIKALWRLEATHYGPTTLADSARPAAG
jgi:hypothetical protein